jgi:dienelactone hydrolase
MRRCGLAAVATVSVAVMALPVAAWGDGIGTDAGPMISVLAGQTMNGQAIPCVAQADGVRVCHGDESGVGGADLRLKSFDGSPLALYVILPPARGSRAEGDYPLLVQNHGWGDPPSGPGDTQYGGPTADKWAGEGVAVLQVTARGWGDSCGNAASRQVNEAACANGYIRLDDERYEARDVQNAVGLLVDEGIVNPNKIGVTGESLGAGLSLELATLKDRVMNADGTLSPWTSPNGTPLHIAAAATFAGFSDLVYALMPNGRTLDTGVTSATADLSPVGVEKGSILYGLYEVGAFYGYYAPPGVNPQADITSWYTAITAGEPYTTSEDKSIIQQIAQFHSPYYLLDGAYGTSREAPAPLFMANGFTDDIFPVDEVLRYYNVERSLYPSDPVSLFAFDGGHQRGQNKPADLALLRRRVKAFLKHYVKGTGEQARTGVTALAQTCPASAPSGRLYHAATWAALHPREVDYSSEPAQTILSTGGDQTIAKTFDPVFGGGACATVAATDQGAGVATYRLPAATRSGYTLLGSPTVTADLNVTGDYAYIAARLLDVNPATNTETLVARGIYRIDSNAPDGPQVFQLYPAAWHFAAGHVAKLELLGQDSGPVPADYTRPSNGVFSISVSNLELQLPVH